MDATTGKENDFQVDLTNCDREPIHIPGLVQQHGVLIALDSDLTITQISRNCDKHFARSAENLLGSLLETLIAQEYILYIRTQIASQNITDQPLYLSPVVINDKTFEVLIHRSGGILIIEFEHPLNGESSLKNNAYSLLTNKLREIGNASSVAEFCQRAAEAVRNFTGFDRVMIYRFMADESGQVIAEAAREDLEPFLGLHYPASDIPKQARALYLRQTLRFKVDADDLSSPIAPTINPQTQAPLDLSYAATRAMSPIHVEYLKNMGVVASMSISIVKDNKLWGLIACHHQTPRYIPHQSRMIGEFIAHTISLEIESKSRAEDYDYVSHLKDSVAQITEELSLSSDVARSLIHGRNNLLSALKGDGAALIFNNDIYLIGRTPGEFHTKKIIEWLWKDQPEEVFSSQQLARDLPFAKDFQSEASGILAVRLTKQRPEYLLWFRAEYAHTVTWAGNPEKPVSLGKFGERLTPRKSFAAWQEEVRGQSKPWMSFEIDYCQRLRRAIVEVILRRADELRELNKQLEMSNTELDSFAYVASHDLKEPLRGINNYSNFLLEDYGSQLDAEAVERLETMVRLTERMENLLDSLLHYSRVGRMNLQQRTIDLQSVLDDALLFLTARIEEQNVKILVPRRLPQVVGDEVRVGEVFSNLISNAIKYNNQPVKNIEIGYIEAVTENIAHESKTEQIFYIKDNGIGIEEKNFDNVFRIFKRLHGRKSYGGGVGAGLTIVKKIIERHNGRIWLESISGEGTTFYFTLG